MEELKELLGEELYNKAKLIIEKITIPKARFNEVSQRLKATEAKQSEYEKQIEEAKKLIDTSEELKTKYATLEDTYKQTLITKEKEINQISKRFDLETELQKSGAKHTNLLLKEVDFENFDKEKTLTTLKEAYPDLFVKEVVKEQTQENTTNENTTNEWDAIFSKF